MSKILELHIMHLLCMMWMVLRQMMRARGRERERDIKV